MVILEIVNLYRVPLDTIGFSSNDCECIITCSAPSIIVSSLIHHDESIFFSSNRCWLIMIFLSFLQWPHSCLSWSFVSRTCSLLAISQGTKQRRWDSRRIKGHRILPTQNFLAWECGRIACYALWNQEVRRWEFVFLKRIIYFSVSTRKSVSSIWSEYTYQLLDILVLGNNPSSYALITFWNNSTRLVQLRHLFP